MWALRNLITACSNQMRINGVNINDLPKPLFPEIDTVQTIVTDELRMLLLFNGLLAYLNSRRPTKIEVSNRDLLHIELT